MSANTFLRLFLPIITAILFVLSFDLRFNLVGFTFFVLIFQSSTFVGLTTTKKVNLLSVFYVFNLIFMGVIPWIHYSFGVVLWRSTPIPDETYVFTNGMIFIANFLVFLPRLLVRNKRKYFQKETEPIGNPSLRGLVLLLFSFTAFWGVFALNDYSFLKLLIRGFLDELTGASTGSSAAALLLSMIYRLTPVFCFFYAITSIPKHRILKLMLFGLLVLSVFPTGVARYMAGFTYIPIMILYFPILRSATVFSNSLIFSLFFGFPFLEQFRYFQGISSLRILPNVEFFFAAHFDAYENMASAIDSGFVTYGHQLLGVMLFFVPRAIWPSKPVGSGYQLAENMNYSFNNISMPFLGEGYVNFGVIGILVFALSLGYILAKLDASFVHILRNKKDRTFGQAVYFFLIGALFFILRGDLLSGFAFMVAGLSIAFFVNFVMRVLAGKRKRVQPPSQSADIGP